MNCPSETDFDEVYYKKLMDGVEFSEINLSNLERTSRIDAEFYQKSNILVEKLLNKWDKNAFSKCFNVSDGNHMSISDSFCDEGVPYYRGQDIYSLFIENSNSLYISQEAYDNPVMRRSYLKKGDVLMSIVGTVGKSALVTSDRQATCSCKLAILRSSSGDILPEMMLIFIKTKYGQSQIQKFKRGAVQTGLLLEDFDQLFIPKFSNEIQNVCKTVVDKAKQLMDEAALIYKEAEELLLETLELKDFEAKDKMYSIKSFQSSFGDTGRLDAEFYQGKYDDYEEILVRYGMFTTIDNVFDIVKDKCMFDEESYNYSEIGDINISNGKFEYNSISVDKLPANAQIMVQLGDLLISKVRPNRGAVSIIDKSVDRHIVSGAFTVLREKGAYKKEILFVLLRTQLYRDWLLKFNVGTSYPTINDNDILKMKIPILPNSVQEKIKEKIDNFNIKLDMSNKFLQRGILMVETAIERGEDVALKMHLW